MVYDQNNNAVGRYEYANASPWDYPFGLVMACSVTEETKEGFAGKEQNEETGLYYFGDRYYDATLGRWSAVDPAGQLATPYGYATDPLLYVDPDGEFAEIIYFAYNAYQYYTYTKAAYNIYQGFKNGGLEGGVYGIIGAARTVITSKIGSEVGESIGLSDSFGGSLLKGGISGGVSGGLASQL